MIGGRVILCRSLKLGDEVVDGNYRGIALGCSDDKDVGR